jgi:rod shape-determining protein MreC
MAGKRNVTGTLISTAIFILMEIAALNMLDRNGAEQHFFMAKWRNAATGWLWETETAVSGYFSLRKTNEALSLENQNLFEELRRYRTAESMASVDSMAATADGEGFRYTPATIVKISRGTQHNYIILGQGSDDGIRPESGIITAQGVVGIVDTVSRHYSYAVSLMNADLNISARLGREGAVGPLSWDGLTSTGAVLREIPLQSKFEPGDTVYTSGFSSIFPSGIPLGTVGDAKVVNGATYDIKVSLLQGINDLKYVIVAENTGRGEIRELEKAKNETGAKKKK